MSCIVPVQLSRPDRNQRSSASGRDILISVSALPPTIDFSPPPPYGMANERPDPAGLSPLEQRPRETKDELSATASARKGRARKVDALELRLGTCDLALAHGY